MTTSAPETGKRPQQGKAARDLNNVIRYTMWSVFAVTERRPGSSTRAGASDEAAEVERLFAELDASDVTVRGVYDVSGLRADADLMVWWHAGEVEALQSAYNGFRRTALGARLSPVWSQTALHRPAEFNKSHVPAFLADEEPKDYVCVYPFVRSYEWYLLPDAERRALLAEHGQLARDYPGRPRQHGRIVRPRGLRVDPRVRGSRALPHRRPHAPSPQQRDPPPRARGGPVLHGSPAVGRRRSWPRCPSARCPTPRRRRARAPATRC